MQYYNTDYDSNITKPRPHALCQLKNKNSLTKGLAEKSKLWGVKWVSHSSLSHSGTHLASKRGCGGCGVAGREDWQTWHREAAGIECLKSLTSDRNMSYTYLCSDRLTGVFKRNRAWRLSAKLAAWQSRLWKFNMTQNMFVEPGVGQRCVCVCRGFGCCNRTDISLLLVDFGEAPPEGTGHNGGGIQWERNLFFFFFFTKRTQISREHKKTSTSNGHPWVKPLCPVHSDFETFECWRLSSLTDQKRTYLSLSALTHSHNPFVKTFFTTMTHTERAVLQLETHAQNQG